MARGCILAAGPSRRMMARPFPAPFPPYPIVADEPGRSTRYADVSGDNSRMIPKYCKRHHSQSSLGPDPACPFARQKRHRRSFAVRHKRRTTPMVRSRPIVD